MGNIFNPENAGALPSFVGNAGKFLRVNTAENAVIFDGVNNNIALPFVANAATFHITDSGNFSIDLSGALTANGALTAVFDVPADSAMVIFDNKTTGNFPVILNGAYTIPNGVSLWYWNGATLEVVAGSTYVTPTISPLPPTNTAVSVAHNFGSVVKSVRLQLVNVTADGGFVPGDSVDNVFLWNGAAVNKPVGCWFSASNMGFNVVNTLNFGLVNKTTNAEFYPTLANWGYRFVMEI